MAKQSLRDFQSQLAQRLRSASSSRSASQLGFFAGGRHWLADLADLAEVVSVQEITAVPWTQPWFIGLANVRGELYGCTDLAAYIAQASTPAQGENNLVLVHPRLGVNAAMRVAHTLGLYNTEEMSDRDLPAGAPDWVKGGRQDSDGRTWWVMDVGKLVTSPRFLDVMADPLSHGRRAGPS